MSSNGRGEALLQESRVDRTNMFTVCRKEDATTPLQAQMKFCFIMILSLVFLWQAPAVWGIECFDVVTLTTGGTANDAGYHITDVLSWSPDGSRILFESGGDMYMMSSDGSNQINLSTAFDVSNWPVWSPDGERIAYVSSGGIISVMMADGSGQVSLANGLYPAWSPDGIRLAYSTAGSIHTMNSDGSDQILIADGTHPKWSPDGSRIGYVSSEGIDVIGSDGSNPFNLVNHSVFSAAFKWSPSGDDIAFISQKDGNREIYLIGSDGANERRLTNDPSDDMWPEWSPDGAHIVVETCCGDGSDELYIMDVNGDNRINITNSTAQDEFPKWSPDGQWILFSSDRGGQRFDLYKIWVGCDEASCDTLWVETTNIRYGPDGCRVPVMLSNCTQLEGLTIPLVYDPLPDGWSCDSVSLVDSRMADWDLVTKTISPLDNTVLVEGLVDIDGGGKLVEPAETGALFYIWISGPSTPTTYDDLTDVICFDTTTIPASPSNKKLLFVEDATPSVGFVPVFVEGCVNLHHYRPIDLDCNNELNSVDLSNLIDIVFFGDPCGCVCAASDVNSDGFTDAIDLSIAIDCIFFGAICPVCDDPSAPAPLARLTECQADAGLTLSYPQSEMWEATLNINSPVSWRIAKLKWEFETPPDNLQVDLSEGAAGLTSYWRQDGQSLIIGLLDVQGEVVIPSGDRSIVRVTGAGSMPGIRLTEGMLVDPSHEGIAVRPVGAAGLASSVPVSFDLSQNYPNPFNAGTVIQYSTGADGAVRFEIFNILGHRVRTLVDKYESAGRHEVVWDGTDESGNTLASGMYFYRLTTNERVESRKMVLLK